MKKAALLCMMSAILLIFVSCDRSKQSITRTDTPTSGTAVFASDECFAPIIDEEIAVFEGLNPDASLTPIYTNEVEAINLLLKDSLRLVIAARELTEAEKQGLINKGRQPRSQKIAVDGIALIINKQNTDSLMSLAMLKKIMTGKISSWKEINPKSKYDKISVVFDNPSSSTVRFIKDSICRKESFAADIKAQPSNEAVIDYVAKTPNALGVIGVNWISNPNDSTNLSFVQNITVMSVSRYDEPTLDDSFKPYPAYLALGDYPLTRDVFFILSDVPRTLPAGFVTFLAGDRGQRIITKAGLLPATRPMRIIAVKEGF